MLSLTRFLLWNKIFVECRVLGHYNRVMNARSSLSVASRLMRSRVLTLIKVLVVVRLVVVRSEGVRSFIESLLRGLSLS